MKESHIESRCVELAKAAGYQSRKVKFIGQNGAPDRIFFKPGRFLWVEMKAKDGKLSALQEHQQDQLRLSGQEVHTIYTVDQFKEILSLGN